MLVVIVTLAAGFMPAPLASQERISCGALRAQYENSSAASAKTFRDWVLTNWPSGRYDRCIGAETALTNREKRYCYNIAITYGHMRDSPAKRQDRNAWGRMRCETFLGRELPTGPLPPEEEARYTAALRQLSPP
jgi:hypothetical protein